MKIGLITTLDTNVGDDFIREGICHLMELSFPGRALQFVTINKHNPYSVYPCWHPVHLRSAAGNLPLVGHSAKRMVETFFARLCFSRFDGCDLIVQCGAPVFWPHCYLNEWAKPLWYEVVGRLSKNVPVWNLAAGSCYPWEQQPSIIEQPEDVRYIRDILQFCRITTVRDRLANKICIASGKNVELIPCTAFLASPDIHADQGPSRVILLNYMSGGGHFSWGQPIDAEKWEKTVKRLITRLSKRHKLAFLCHDEKEVALARHIDSNLHIFFPKTTEEYFKCVAQAKFGIFNRLHASVGIAGLGIPSIAIGTDTRMLMVSELGLSTHYVNEVDEMILEQEVEDAMKVLPHEQERLLKLKNETLEKYLLLMNNAILSQ